MSTLILTLFSFIGGVVGLISAYQNNMLILKISTVISCLFCLRHVDFICTRANRFSRKLFTIILGNIIAKAINHFCTAPITNLNWIIINGLFTIMSALTILDIIRDMRDSY